MNKPISWTKRASKDLKKVFRFYAKLYGNIKAGEITLDIRKHTEVLKNPEFDFEKAGGIDQFFQHLKRDYRILIYKHIKITYREGKTKIYIVRVFDTRQDPNKNL